MTHENATSIGQAAIRRADASEYEVHDWSEWLKELRARLDPPATSEKRRVWIARSYGNRSTASIVRFTGLSRYRVQQIVNGVRAEPALSEQQESDAQRIRAAYDRGKTTGLAISISTQIPEWRVAPHLAAIRKGLNQERAT